MNDDLIISRFEEINDFYTIYNREPNHTHNNEYEYKLAERLLNMQLRGDILVIIEPYDCYGMLF